jgi:hypothetical protein
MSQEDMGRLLSALLPFAQQKLNENGSFAPFAGTVDAQGQVRGFAPKPEAEHMPPGEMVELLETSLRESAQRGECRATAVCCDVRVARESEGEKIEAIALSMESADGTSLECFLPYKKLESGEYEYADVFGGPAPARIFPAAAPPAHSE